MTKIHLIFGPQGAGKTTYAKQLAVERKAVHLSIDDWMWKLFGEDMPKSMNLKWIMERVERCEKQIWATAQKIADCGSEVILDLGFTKVAKRKQFESLAAAQNYPTQLHYIYAPHAIRRQRVLARNVAQGDTFSFEVTPGMFDFMEGEFHRATDGELARAVVVDTNDK